MKNLKFIVTAFLMLAMAMSLSAQINLGVRGGITLAKYNQIFEDYELKNLTGYDFALFSEFKLNSLFSIQPEVHFLRKGAKIAGDMQEMGYENIDFEGFFRYNYLEIPVLARINIADGSEKFFFNFFVGPAIGYATSGEIESKTISSESGIESGTYKDKIDIDDEDRWDLSGVAGVGVEYDTGPVLVLFDARYSMEFADFTGSDVDYSDKIFNRVLSFTAGVSVPLNGK